MNLFVSNNTLQSFGDIILFRDPKGRSVFRSLHPVRIGNTQGLNITGPFIIQQLFSVSKEEGISFVSVTGDENPIHREGDIVPGAMTCARAVSGLEALFPTFGISHLKIKFRSIARYDRNMRQQVIFSSLTKKDAILRIKISQSGKEVARGLIKGTFKDELVRPNVRKRKVNKEELKRVEDYFLSLNINPDLFLKAGGEPNLAYPRGYIASLPSGEMVRQFSGEGGILSSLELKFSEDKPLPISGSNSLIVSLKPAKSRPSFSKILTMIKSGVEEYCKGFALVFLPNVTGLPESAVS